MILWTFLLITQLLMWKAIMVLSHPTSNSSANPASSPTTHTPKAAPSHHQLLSPWPQSPILHCHHCLPPIFFLLLPILQGKPLILQNLNQINITPCSKPSWSFSYPLELIQWGPASVPCSLFSILSSSQLLEYSNYISCFGAFVLAGFPPEMFLPYLSPWLTSSHWSGLCSNVTSKRPTLTTDLKFWPPSVLSYLALF